MGAAIEVFEGATAIGVGRDRFLPVKTTNDLLLLRSDVYEVGGDGRLTKVTDPAPLVDLDSTYYKTIGAFEQRIPDEAPSLKEAQSLTVKGDWTFEPGVVVAARRSSPTPEHHRPCDPAPCWSENSSGDGDDVVVVEARQPRPVRG